MFQSKACIIKTVRGPSGGHARIAKVSVIGHQNYMVFPVRLDVTALAAAPAHGWHIPHNTHSIKFAFLFPFYSVYGGHHANCCLFNYTARFHSDGGRGSRLESKTSHVNI